MKQRAVSLVLWLAFVLALASSVSHLAWAFGRYEFSGFAWVGWLPAVAVDAGLAALAYQIQQRRRAKRATGVLWLGVGGFSVISAAANLYHAAAVVLSAPPTVSTVATIDPIAAIMAALLSATLPALVLYLGEVVSSDDANAATLADRERQTAERARQRAADNPPVEAKPAPPAERRRITAEEWRAMVAQLNGQRATLTPAAAVELIAAAGMEPPPETTLRRWVTFVTQNKDN